MDDSPDAAGSAPHHRAAVQKARPVCEMERHDGDPVASILNQEILGLDIHVRRRRSVTADLFEDRPEGVFEFGSSMSPCRNCARIEDGGVILERQAERFPIEVVESRDESR